MTRRINIKARMIGVVLCLTACVDDERPASNAAIDADSAPLVKDSSADDYDAASCDPLAFEKELDASAANITAALDPRCFHSGVARRALVLEALCAHDMECASGEPQDCRMEYEACWQEGVVRQNGLSVPCMDALLDALSCMAQASCGDARACASANERADAACNPNTPRGTECPPLPDDREWTRGPIPEDAITDAGMYDETRIPDFIPVWDRSGENIAGYVRFCARLGGGAEPVYADDLTTVVGHMIPGEGFVSGPLPKPKSLRSCWPRP